MTAARRQPWKSPSLAPAPQGGETSALLRQAADNDAGRVQVRYCGAELWVEVSQGSRTLLSGNWCATLQLTEDSPLAPAGAWSDICWHSDADVDYLELELPLAAGWRLQRQILLAREDGFLFLADAALAPASINGDRPLLRLESRLPLAAGLALAPEKESREAYFTAGGKKIASVLPLALAEWRVEHSPGGLDTKDDRLAWHVLGEGRGVLAPLLIDLDSKRAKQPLTWRRLTVAQDRHIVGRDVAVGYRAQAGKSHWLFYRALASRGNRTVLGYNTSFEFGAIRFLPNGAPKPLLEIE